MSNRTRYTMAFTAYPDLTTAHPTVLRAHRLTREDLERYDQKRGCFRNQRIRFAYAGIAPKVGDFIVKYAECTRFPVAAGIVTLVGARRLFEITGDTQALQELGTLKDEASCQ